jgi:hypothetical protein
MPRKDTTQTSRIKWRIFLLVIATLLFAPIAIYIYTFGVRITDSHARWGEMGSAMSGLYTPVLSLLTLLVLFTQIRLQEAMNKHAFDQSYIQEIRSDSQYYLSQLSQELSNEFDNGSEIGTELIAAFAYAPIQDIQRQDYAKVAAEVNRKYPRIMANWSAFYPLLAGLKANSFYPYEHNYIAAKQKAIVLLSFDGCVALDNFIWCASNGNLKFAYVFSQGLHTQQ